MSLFLWSLLKKNENLVFFLRYQKNVNYYFFNILDKCIVLKLYNNGILRFI